MARKLDELETLLNRIWSGELNHNQVKYYTDCGTAACVCGWDYAIDHFDGELFRVLWSGAWSPFQYSQEKYNLSRIEALLFFASSSTAIVQKAALKALREGRTLNCTGAFTIASHGYWDDSVIVARGNELCLKLSEFLGNAIPVAPSVGEPVNWLCA